MALMGEKGQRTQAAHPGGHHGGAPARVVHAADSQDRDGAKQALVGIKERFPRLEHLSADGAYTGEFIDWALRTPRDHGGNRQAA